MTNDNTASNLSLADLQEWADIRVARGEWSKSERNRLLGALEALMAVLIEDEPSDLGYVLENLDSIRLRWVTGGNKNPATGQTYQGRAKRVLETFVTYKLTGKMPARKTPAPHKPKSKAKVTAVVSAPTPASGLDDLRSFPLEGDGRDIRYVFPRDAKQVELRRFYFHLCTLAVDFDPAEFQTL